MKSEIASAAVRRLMILIHAVNVGALVLESVEECEEN